MHPLRLLAPASSKVADAATLPCPAGCTASVLTYNKPICASIVCTASAAQRPTHEAATYSLD
jgi:hypothetical protein